MTIAMGDDRHQHEEDGARDHATMKAEFDRMAAGSDRMRTIGQGFSGRYAQGARAVEQMRFEYLHFVVDTTIAGLDAMLHADAVAGTAGGDGADAQQ